MPDQSGPGRLGFECPIDSGSCVAACATANEFETDALHGNATYADASVVYSVRYKGLGRRSGMALAASRDANTPGRDADPDLIATCLRKHGSVFGGPTDLIAMRAAPQMTADG